MIHIGNSTELIFGGMDKLITPKWDFDGFVKNFIFLEPNIVLSNPVDLMELFKSYRLEDKGIDYMKFIDKVFAIESLSSYSMLLV